MLIDDMKYKIARIAEHPDKGGRFIDYRVLNIELWQYKEPGMSTITISNLECNNKQAQQYFDAYKNDKVISLSLNTLD